MPSHAEIFDLSKLIDQKARDLIRDLNDESIALLGRPYLVATEFCILGRPIGYRRWEEYQAGRQASKA